MRMTTGWRDKKEIYFRTIWLEIRQTEKIFCSWCIQLSLSCFEFIFSSDWKIWYQYILNIYQSIIRANEVAGRSAVNDKVAINWLTIIDELFLWFSE